MQQKIIRMRFATVTDLESLKVLLPFDIQLFAADDEGRTEEPTEKKLREAREKGQVAKTTELPSSLVVIFGFLIIFFLGSWIFDTLARMTVFYLSNFSRFSITEKSVIVELFRSMEILGMTLLPVFIGVVIAAILGNVAQVGFQFSLHPIMVDFSKIKLDPSEMIKKVFFSPQIGMNLLKILVKLAAIGLVSYVVIAGSMTDLVKLPDISVSASLVLVSSIALKIAVWSSVVILLLAIPDYIFQRREFLESLKMSKQEIKQELKESQGDPHVRARLKQLQREMLQRNMIREVPRADVIVTNPTHFAVALRFEREKMASPQVIAKGVDAIALRIREIAKEHGVATIENRPLAQELYKRLEIGDFIPEDLYKAVSLVYAELYRTRDMRAAI
ncbi:MAG TPA: flagellar biosynthesis protein FlhB [Spirochaetota bacterium]